MPLFVVNRAVFAVRLTPKPNRIKMKAYKVKYPRVEADLQLKPGCRAMKRRAETSAYVNSSKLLEQITGRLRRVRLHDDFTGADLHLPLA